MTKTTTIIFLLLSHLIFAQDISNKKSKKPNLFIDLYLGSISNKMFGNHFILYSGISLSFNEKNYYGLSFEKNFGDSQKTYQVYGDEELFDTKEFGKYNFGIFYKSLVLDKSKDKLSLHTAISIDQINIDSNEFLENEKILLGLGLEAAIEYKHIFKSKHSIPIMFVYHFSNIKNKNGTKLNPNYLSIRFTYNFEG